MIQSFNKRILKYYQFTLILISLSILGTIYYFWSLGFLDGSRAKNLHQSSYILESYEAKPQLKDVKELVGVEDYKLAIKKIRDIESDFKKIDLNLKTPEYRELKSEFQKLKTSTTNLLSFQKTSKVLAVFNSKMDKFYDYVKENKWRTLTRMSERVYSMTRGGIKISRINPLVKDVNKDFNSMIRITENSILDRKYKSEIVSRIKNLQVEMTMLKKYAGELDFFEQLFKETERSVDAWFAAVAPELTLQKIRVEQTGRFYVMGLGLLFLLTLALFAIGIPVVKWINRKENKALEKQIEELVSERIIEAKSSVLFEASSQDFQDYCEKISRYVNKRMSMGSIFQESLPLASILLDENLQVIWSNKQFSEDWMIDEEEMKKDYMTWDFLNKLTNLGQDDPVIEALKHGVAGIYQVQVKPSEDLTARPYEMFVSPVSYNDKRRIQLFFYDLRSLEQTIKDQAQGLITPIKRTLKSLKANEFAPNEELKQSFMLAGIKDVYELFVDNFEKNELEKDSLIDQIELLSAEVENYQKKSLFTKETIGNTFEVNRANVESLKAFKDNVLSLSIEARELDRQFKRSLEVINTNIGALTHNKNKTEGLIGLLTEIYESLPNYGALKSELKELRSQLKSAEHQAIDKKLSSLEIVLSKAEMILSSGRSKMDSLEVQYEREQLIYAQNETKSMSKIAGSSLESLEQSEAEIVENLQQIFTGTKTQLRLTNDVWSQFEDHLNN